MKKIEELIISIFKCNKYTLTKVEKGITNQNYLLNINNDKYIVRIPYSDSKSLFNRSNELIVENSIKDLNISTNLIYFNIETGIKITKFINCKSYSNYNEEQVILIANKLKKLHSIKNNINFKFNHIDKYNQFKSNIKDQLFDLDKYEYILKDIDLSEDNFVLCHNDLVADNLLFTDNDLFIIDYEYAALNNPLFDIMSFISENNIYDENLRNVFYNAYFNDINDELLKQLNKWENYHNLLWCTWANMLYDYRKEPIYLEIATLKYEALVNGCK